MPSISISSSRFPLLLNSATGGVLEWGQGELYSVLLTSRSLRVSKLGVQWCPLCSDTALGNSNALSTLTPLTGWSGGTSCVAANTALCRTTSSRPMTLFPVDNVHVPLHWKFDSTVTACNSNTANREIMIGAQDYQVSLCDLTDSNLEFVLDTTRSLLYWKQENKPVWWSVVATLFCLFFFTRVCEHLSMLVRGERRLFSVATTIAILGILLLWRCLLASGVLSQHLITQEELLLNVLLEGYCYLYIIMELTHNVAMLRASTYKYYQHFVAYYYIAYYYIVLRKDYQYLCMLEVTAQHKQCNDISTLGSLIAVQLILTAQLANTYENPFLGILTLLFGSRVFLKFMNFMLVHTVTGENAKTVLSKFCVFAVDTLALVAVFELGVRVAARSAAEYASTASGMLFIIVLGGSFLHTVIECHKLS